MRGKTCLITGATSGIGRAAAMELARQGATVIIVGRDPTRVADTIVHIKKALNTPITLDYLLADLSSQAQIRQLANSFMRRFSQLHVLVNNAGGMFMQHQLSEDGIEMTFALNHLSHFLLTNLLLDILKASAPSRVINVSSGSHKLVRQIDYRNLSGQCSYNGMRAYWQSKLANVFFTYELARRLEGTGITINATSPGLVATNLGKNNGWLFKLIRRLVMLMAKPSEEGAESIIHLATAPEVISVSGKYFVRKSATSSSASSYDQDSARMLWLISTILTSLYSSR